jgi:hypothetical protein
MRTRYRPVLIVILVIIAISLALSACATRQQRQSVEFTPRPTESAVERTENGRVIYHVPIAAEPQGTVEITAEGRKDVRLEIDAAEHLPVLHIQMTIHNQSGLVDWNFDTRMQQVNLGGGLEPLRPAFANANGSGQELPFVRVARGTAKVVDLYYVLPAGAGPQDTQRWTLSWQISANGHLMTETAQFSPAAETGTRVSVYPFDADEPVATQPNREPAAVPDRPMPHFGVQPDWWVDPYADLPPTWRDAFRR